MRLPETRRGRRAAPELPVGASNAVLNRRFISLCSELSSRSGSQRTMVIEVPPFTERIETSSWARL